MLVNNSVLRRCSLLDRRWSASEALARSQQSFHAAMKSWQCFSLWLRRARHHWLAPAPLVPRLCSIGACAKRVDAAETASEYFRILV